MVAIDQGEASMIPMKGSCGKKMIPEYGLFSQCSSWFCQAVEPCEKIISKAPLFSSVISGILERGPRVGRRITTIFWPFRRRVVTGKPFGWCLV